MSTDPDDRSQQAHRPRCCDEPTPLASWGMGRHTVHHDNAFITVWCDNCGTDLITLDPPSGGDRSVYIGPWDWRRDQESAEPAPQENDT